jgi:hypothetical protein
VQSNYDVAIQILELTGLLKAGYVEAYVDLTIQDLGDHFKKSPLTLVDGQRSSGAVNLLFLDHDKDVYLSDLKSIALDLNLLEDGAFVVADNVLIAKIEDYLKWVRGGSLSVNQDGKVEEIGNNSSASAKDDDDEKGTTILFESSTLFKSRVEYCTAEDVEEYGAESVVDGVEVSVWKGA